MTKYNGKDRCGESRVGDGTGEEGRGRECRSIERLDRGWGKGYIKRIISLMHKIVVAYVIFLFLIFLFGGMQAFKYIILTIVIIGIFSKHE